MLRIVSRRSASSASWLSFVPSARVAPGAPEPPRRRRYSEGRIGTGSGSGPGSGARSCSDGRAVMATASSHPGPVPAATPSVLMGEYGRTRPLLHLAGRISRPRDEADDLTGRLGDQQEPDGRSRPAQLRAVSLGRDQPRGADE